MKERKRPLVVCVTGPTATGKTAAGIAICKALGGEVISMDSMQIYQTLSIGTAKPSPEEMREAPHHMVSCVPPDRPYSVADYQRDARAVMRGVLGRRKLPVFVGGTGLYLQAVSRPLRFTLAEGGEDSAIRRQLEAEAERAGGREALFERLRAADPESAERLHPNNVRRVIRALQVYLETGIPMSGQTDEWTREPEEDWLIFAMTYPRDQLYQRINRRVDGMMAAGLAEEVEALLKAGLSPECQAMQAIGYKELAASLRGECSREEAVERIKMNSRRYAKRQITWLRRDPRVHWVDVDAYGSPEAAAGAMIGWIRERRGGHDTCQA